MTTILHATTSIFTKVSGDEKRFGDAGVPYQISIDGDVISKSLTVAADGTATLYDGSVDGFATASFYWIRSWYTIAIEVTYDTAGTYGVQYYPARVVGSGEDNKFGPALWVPDAKSYANYTAAFAAGTFVYPDLIKMKNLDSTNATRVEFFCGD